MVPVSNDTFLRVVRRRASPPVEAPTVAGIDDWAFRRNHRYGTIVCDLERRQIVTLLPDREIATAPAWLAAHPGIKVISREGVSIRQIVRRVGHSRNLVRQVLRGERTEVFPSRQSTIDAYLPFLDAQWTGGCRKGAELWRRLRGG